VFAQLADGKLNGQKAFMTGALKVKGNVSLPTRGSNVTDSRSCLRYVLQASTGVCAD